MIIKSLLDTDLYKFRMLAFAKNILPDVIVEYSFKIRNKIDILSVVPLEVIVEELRYLCTLRFTGSEVSYLNTIIEPDFKSKGKLDFLEYYINHSILDFSNVYIEVINGELSIRVVGKWFKTILFETFVLAIVNELYNTYNKDPEYLKDIYEKSLTVFREKANLIHKHELKVCEFGTRRRFSYTNQFKILNEALLFETFIGTSNVYFGYINHSKKVFGTFAHEAYSVYQGLYHPILSSRKFLKDWLDYFGSLNSSALTDIYPHKKFLKDFDYELANSYGGVRHDSGNIDMWTTTLIEHYLNLGINPKTKTFMYSDGLDLPSAIAINEKYKDKVNVVFGIGTNLTNDVPGGIALQCVMKIVKVNGNHVAKISNNLGKSMCEDALYQEWLIKTLEKEVGEL